MIRRGQFIFLVFLILLLSILVFVGCNKSSKNVGISNEDAQKLSLDGITVAGNGTANISNLIRDKSGKENNIKKRETSGDGQLKYDITIQDYGASENHGFDFITVDKTSAAPGETVTFQTHVQWVNDSHTEKREISSIAIEGEYVEIQNNSFVMPARDAKILVMIGVYRKIVIQQPANGRINTNKEWYDVGMQEDINITLNPNNGYSYKENTLVLSWEGGYGPESETLYVDSETKTATHYLPYSYSEVTLTCEFEIPQAPTYNVYVDSSLENGSISVTKNSFEQNEKVVVTVTPNSGYKLDRLLYNKNPFDGRTTLITKVNNEYSFNMPNYDIVIGATFIENIYTITVNAPNGTVVLRNDDNDILENNTSRAKEGVNVYYTPNSGYILESVSLNDNDIVLWNNSGQEKVRFEMPEADVTLTASFVEDTSAFLLWGPEFAYINGEYNTSAGEITLGDFKIQNVYCDTAVRNDDNLLTLIYEVKCYNGDQDYLGEFVNVNLITIALEIESSTIGTFRTYGMSSINLFGVTTVHPLYGDDYLKGYVRITLFDDGNEFHASEYVGDDVQYILYARPILLYEI